MRIVIVGGGSFQWVPTLTTDLALTPSLRGAEVVLQDIDAARLARTAPVVEHVSDLTGAEFAVRATTDQREALRGADFVLVNITTGGFESMAFDLDIPWRYGIRQPGGDTMGPGGINRALRNIPVLDRHRAEHGGRLRRRVAAQPHESDDCALPIGYQGDLDQDGRPVPRGHELPRRPHAARGRGLERHRPVGHGSEPRAGRHRDRSGRRPRRHGVPAGGARRQDRPRRRSRLRHRRRRARAPGQLRLGARASARDEAVLRRGVRRGFRAVPPFRRVRRAREPSHTRSVPGDARSRR